MFKWVLPAIVVALLSASGCCCVGPCGPFGHGLICKPGCGIECRSQCDTCNSSGCCAPCGPSLTCSDCCGGIKYWLNGRCYAGRSCGQRYWGEWISDPPYCCDPCNRCADFVGPQCCGPGPLLRLWNAIACNPCCNSCCNSCGGAGCDACGGGYSTAYSSSYGGGGCSTCGGGHGNIMHENWDHQSQPVVPGQLNHNAAQPTPARMTQRMPVAPQQMAPRNAVMRASGQQPVNTMRR